MAVATVLVACTPDAAPEGPPAHAESRAASPVPATDPPEDPCRVRQRHAVQALEWPFQESSERVSSAFSGRSEVAARRLLRRIEGAYDRVSDDCGTTPVQMTPFVTTVRRTTRRALDADRLDAALAAYRRWSGQVGGSKYADRMIASVRGCRAMSHRVHAEDPAVVAEVQLDRVPIPTGPRVVACGRASSVSADDPPQSLRSAAGPEPSPVTQACP